MAPNPNSARKKAMLGHVPARAWPRIAAECVITAAALQNTEAEQDRDRPDVGDDEIQKTRAADLGDAVLGDDQEERRQRHRLPGDHEEIGVIGDQHHRHRCEERVILKADERRGAFLRWFGNILRNRATPGPRRRPGAARKNADRGSSRRWNGRSGSPSGRTRVCGGAPIAVSATAASAIPTAALAGNRYRLMKVR